MADALKRPEPSLYDRDYYAWTLDQAAKLRARASFDNRGDIDWENAAEEIPSLGRSERREIESRMSVLLVHLLKWCYQPDRRSRSLRGTIIEQRAQLAREMRVSPSLSSYPASVVTEDYQTIRAKVLGETNLPEATFPAECPFKIEQILDPEFYPEAS